jgi:hypothetical protein
MSTGTTTTIVVILGLAAYVYTMFATVHYPTRALNAPFRYPPLSSNNDLVHRTQVFAHNTE